MSSVTCCLPLGPVVRMGNEVRAIRSADLVAVLRALGSHDAVCPPHAMETRTGVAIHEASSPEARHRPAAARRSSGRFAARAYEAPIPWRRVAGLASLVLRNRDGIAARPSGGATSRPVE